MKKYCCPRPVKGPLFLSVFLAAIMFYSCNRGRPCFKPTLDLTREPYGATDEFGVRSKH